eukprot:6520348-Prymnesium_polylepis.1
MSRAPQRASRVLRARTARSGLPLHCRASVAPTVTRRVSRVARSARPQTLASSAPREASSKRFARSAPLRLPDAARRASSARPA